MKLVDNAGKWYRMFSVQALAVIGAAQGAIAVLPPRWLERPVPLTGGTTLDDVLVGLSTLAAILGIVGRLVDQGSTKIEPPTNPPAG